MASATAAPAASDTVSAVGADVIQYVGIADVCKITKAEWRSVDVDQEASEWNDDNDHKLPVSEFSADALRYFEKKDPARFKRTKA